MYASGVGRARGARGGSRRCGPAARRGGRAARGCGARGRGRSRRRPPRTRPGRTPEPGRASSTMKRWRLPRRRARRPERADPCQSLACFFVLWKCSSSSWKLGSRHPPLSTRCRPGGRCPRAHSGRRQAPRRRRAVAAPGPRPRGGRRRPGRAPDHRRDRRRHRRSRCPPCTGCCARSSTAATCGRCPTVATRSGSGWSRSAPPRARWWARTPRRCWPARRRARRDRQPGDPVRLPRGVRRPGAVAAHDADVHRGRPSGRPALHRRGQGAARPSSTTPGSATIVRRVGLPAQTEHTLVTEAALLADLADDPGARLRPRRAGAGGRGPLRRRAASDRSRCPGWRCRSPDRSPG